MDTTIPYHPGLLLGRSVDMKTLQMGYMLVGEECTPTAPQVNLTTAQFSFINSLKDVCDVLSIPPEYALKVKAKVSNNFDYEVITECLRGLGRKDTCTLVFRICFLQQKKYLPQDVIPLNAESKGKRKEATGETSLEMLSLSSADSISQSLTQTSEDAVAGAPPTSTASPTSLDANPAGEMPADNNMKKHGTHWVKAVEIGNELIAVIKLSSRDVEKRSKLHLKLCEALGSYRGLLDDKKMEELAKVAADIDKKLEKKQYEDVKMDICYCSYQELPKYPAEFAGMVKTMENFRDQCVGWTQDFKYGLNCNVEARSMIFKPGVDREEKISRADAIIKKLTSFMESAPAAQPHQQLEQHQTHSKEAFTEEADTDIDNDHDSFVVLPSARYLYNLRVTLQSFEGENEADLTGSLSSLAMSQYPEATYNNFEHLFKVLVNCDAANTRMQAFVAGKRFSLDNRVVEANEVLHSIQVTHMAVSDLIASLDLVHLPDSNQLEVLFKANPLDTVNLFIENVTSKLPPGCDIDILMIGKTGHGKSSTGNSILGQNRFHSSADGESVTTNTGVGWAQIDGRTIKVVDTPGVCDTNLDTEESSIDLAIRSISDAIANCPDGFHALLLIIRFGIRMTSEERKAIGMLKCVLGEDIIKSHCVCVVTHGDNFEKETTESFDDWCHRQKGFLQEIFEECNYRCVLFNNKSTDSKVKKAQLIRLVAHVDSLKSHGTRYTNAIFEFAQRERQRVITEERVPQVNEDMMRDIQMVLEYLNTMVHNTNEEEKYKEELSKLREKVDNLQNRVTETENGQMGCLVDTVFALAATLHDKMDEIADRPEPDKPDEVSGDGAPNTLMPASGEDTTSTLKPEATNAKRAESPMDNMFLERFRGEMQTYYDEEISPKASMVNDRVASAVKEEVKKEKNCFPGNSTVQLGNGSTIALEDLQVGDKVLVRNSNGKMEFDTVIMFGHQSPLESREYLVFRSDKKSVSVSGEHYAYCMKEGKEQCVAAKDVKIGDSLLMLSPGGLTSHPISEIIYERKKGLYAPFTTSGTIVVDGALMSCYVDVLRPQTCHKLLWPVRQLYRLSPQALAMVNSTSQQSVPVWATAAMKLM